MRFQATIILLAGFLAKGSFAITVAEPEPDNLVPSRVENVDASGSLVYYGTSASKDRRSEDPTHIEHAADGGSLVYYGNSKTRRNNEDDKDEDGDLEKRIWPFNTETKGCKEDTSPDCDDKNGAANDVCDKLVTALYGYSDIEIPKDDRQICYQAENGSNKCCIKWTKELSGLHKSDLAPFAQKMFEQCTENGISGKLNHVYLKDKCVSICMSKGAGCKNKAG